MQEINKYLHASSFFDFESSSVQEYGDQLVGAEKDPIKIAKKLYLGVRDDIRYNAYTFDKNPTTFSASFCLAKRESYCIPKAVLLAALCRLYGIPARIGLADVRNHMASQQFLDYLKSDIFVMHGYTDIFLHDQWVKATPAFDQGLCRLMNIKPLEFDGVNDSIFHQFDENGNQHMEYIREHGVFAELPHHFILKGVAEAYPHLADENLADFQTHSMYEEIVSEKAFD